MISGGRGRRRFRLSHHDRRSPGSGASPPVKGKLSGFALASRPRTFQWSDLVAELEQSPVTVEEINQTLKEASEDSRKGGRWGYNELPLVSSDYTGDPRSSISLTAYRRW